MAGMLDNAVLAVHIPRDGTWKGSLPLHERIPKSNIPVCFSFLSCLEIIHVCKD